MNVTGSNFLDSSAWIEYFEGNKSVQELVDGASKLFGSVISVFEIRRKLRREKVANDTLNRITAFMRRRATLVEINFDVSLLASSYAEKLHAIDALIYASARKVNSVLITGDNDFRGLDGVEIIK